MNDAVKNNIKLFAQLGLQVTEAEATKLAKKVEFEVKAGRTPTFDDVKGFLADMREAAKAQTQVPYRRPAHALGSNKPADFCTKAETNRIAKGLRYKLPSLERLDSKVTRDPVTLEIIPETPTNNPPCSTCGETYNSNEMIRYPVIGFSLSICAYCADQSTYKHLIGGKETITKRVTAAELKAFKAEMVASHPDKGGTDAEFIKKHKKHTNAAKLTV